MGRFGLFHFFLPSLVPQFCACYFRSVSCFVLLFFSVRRLEFCFVNSYTVSIDTHCSIHTLFVGSPFTSPVFSFTQIVKAFSSATIEPNCLLIPFCPSSGVQIGIFSALGVCTLVAHTVLYCFSICLLGCWSLFSFLFLPFCLLQYTSLASLTSIHPFGSFSFCCWSLFFTLGLPRVPNCHRSALPCDVFLPCFTGVLLTANLDLRLGVFGLFLPLRDFVPLFPFFLPFSCFILLPF